MLAGLLVLAQCAASPLPPPDWKEVALPGLRLSLQLPPALERRPWEALSRIARTAKRMGVPATSADSVTLVAAWESRRTSGAEPTQVLLYEIRPDSLPPGRPCSIGVAGAAGSAYRLALSGPGSSTDDFWVEAYWPGHAIAIGGRSMAVYELAFTLIRAIAATP